MKPFLPSDIFAFADDKSLPVSTFTVVENSRQRICALSRPAEIGFLTQKKLMRIFCQVFYKSSLSTKSPSISILRVDIKSGESNNMNVAVHMRKTRTTFSWRSIPFFQAISWSTAPCYLPSKKPFPKSAHSSVSGGSLDNQTQHPLKKTCRKP